jgi:hypothetical protein
LTKKWLARSLCEAQNRLCSRITSRSAGISVRPPPSSTMDADRTDHTLPTFIAFQLDLSGCLCAQSDQIS